MLEFGKQLQSQKSQWAKKGRSTQGPRSGSNADLITTLPGTLPLHGQTGALIWIWHDCLLRAVLSLTQDHIDQNQDPNPTDPF